MEMNERKFACGVTPASINLIAELYNETDPEILHSIRNDERSNKFNIDYVDTMTIKELRVIAKNIKISPKGNKNVLIKRIKDTIISKD